MASCSNRDHNGRLKGDRNQLTILRGNAEDNFAGIDRKKALTLPRGFTIFQRNSTQRNMPRLNLPCLIGIIEAKGLMALNLIGMGGECAHCFDVDVGALYLF